MAITLRQLHYFEALARHGHFGRAAEASAVSQPALSVQIRELESALGTDLFERGPRQARLTPFGERAAPRIAAILRGVEELSELARAAGGDLSGRLRLGLIPTVAPYLVPRLVRAVAEARPGLDLDIRETVTPRLLEELGEGRLDAAIVALPLGEPTLVEAPLLSETFVLVRPEAEAGMPIPDRETLGERRLLLLEEGHCFRDQALSFCALRPSRPGAGLDGASLATLVRMVGAGLGVTLIPEMAVEAETRAAPVATARFPEPQPRREIGMVWRRTTPLAPRLGDLAEDLRAALAG
ncbi:hydrogen peroxide-inducible gene activator [Jannaschia aquimarina]|uniref:OxyR_2 protein n=2 Tax=Jannaschia aquimarina TaxID=935700 RepID=A0A0D1EG95_9RHOB|nr:hydrogen peroxide-inducible gene activator [Jannaschia aquimarina]SNS57418.1 transcriptional regulator, LysR family [Jannaschia aquimarina]